MKIRNLILTLAAVKASIASPMDPTVRGEYEVNVDAIIAKYNLTDDVALPITDSDFGTLARKCYSDDWRWDGEKGYALDRAGRWCSGNGGSGWYNAGQLKGGCYNLNNVKRVNFKIQNLQSRRIELSSSACFSFLRGIINACDRGGENENGSWWWTADSNIGVC